MINKIAAGEVIERPAAVVKELLENSLDAGASRVEVEFRHGGKSYMRIEDDGCGMAPDEALLALERHATSKLRAPGDLLKITSMGFRGEALPSIASISRFTLRTRPEDRSEGTEILINGGKMLHRRDCGMAPGTRIEVANLFNAVPARRKFLKTDNTEAAHIVHLVRLYAMARPDVDFTLIENGRPVFRSPKGADGITRAAEIFGKSLAEPLAEFPGDERDGLRVGGLLGKPGIGRTSRRDMITFVNGRPVDSRTLNYALIEGYHTYMPKGRYPLAFLFLEIDPAAVDVNVHPAKREVRFRDEGAVRRFVLESVHAWLGAQNAQSKVSSQESREPEISDIRSEISDLKTGGASSVEDAMEPEEKPVPTKPITGTPKMPEAIAKLNRTPASQAPERAPAASRSHPAFHIPPSPPKSEINNPKSEIPWRLIGRLHGENVLFETEAGLVVLNLRAAHERVWFEQLQAEFSLGVVASQRLLFPVPMEFDPVAAAALKEHQAFLTEHGFALEEFGRNFYRLEAHPAWLPEGGAEDFVRAVVSALREGALDPKHAQPAREALARMAATRAVRLGDNPTDDEIRNLLERLLKCRQPLSCPRGRATYFELSKREIDKRLGRA